MFDFKIVAASSLSIIFPAAIGLIRWNKIHYSYKPFVVMMLAFLLSEVISITLIYFNRGNAMNVNIMSLAEGLLWIWQFKKWKAFRNTSGYNLVMSFVIVGWIWENVVYARIFTFSSAYAIALSFALVLLSINQVNKQIVEERARLITNAKFLICAGNIIFCTYRIIVECFYLLDMNNTGKFLANVFSILVVVNVFVNLLFAFATLWIPRRQKFSLPYSLLPAS